MLLLITKSLENPLQLVIIAFSNGFVNKKKKISLKFSFCMLTMITFHVYSICHECKFNGDCDGLVPGRSSPHVADIYDYPLI